MIHKSKSLMKRQLADEQEQINELGNYIRKLFEIKEPASQLIEVLIIYIEDIEAYISDTEKFLILAPELTLAWKPIKFIYQDRIEAAKESIQILKFI